jgi:hypothetical protein
MKKTESEKKNSKFEILNSKQIQNLNIQNVFDFGGIV